MFGENSNRYFAQMAKYALKLFTMFGENSDSYFAPKAKYALKLSTMVE